MNPPMTYSILWSEEDGEYVATCAAFPSLSWLAPSRHLAFLGIRALVKAAVEDLRQRGELVLESGPGVSLN